MGSDDDDDDDSSVYEPEYEPETFDLGGYAAAANKCEENEGRLESKSRFTFEVLSVIPPPLEYMCTLHDRKEEISGRQVWCGSMLLCHYLLLNTGGRSRSREGSVPGGATAPPENDEDGSDPLWDGTFEGKR